MVLVYLIWIPSLIQTQLVTFAASSKKGKIAAASHASFSRLGNQSTPPAATGLEQCVIVSYSINRSIHKSLKMHVHVCILLF